MEETGPQIPDMNIASLYHKFARRYSSNPQLALSQFGHELVSKARELDMAPYLASIFERHPELHDAGLLDELRSYILLYHELICSVELKMLPRKSALNVP